MTVAGVTTDRGADRAPGTALSRLSFRFRVIAGLSLLGGLVWLLLASVLILNARIAVEREIRHSFDMAGQTIEASLREAGPTVADGDSVMRMAAGPDGLRHVQVTARGPGGGMLPARDADTAGDGDDDDAEAPDWFVALTDVAPLRRGFSVAVADGGVYDLVLESHSRDEINEVWEDFRLIVPITMGYTVVLVAAAVFFLNGLFNRLKTMSRALLRLRDGPTGEQLARPDIPELAPIVSCFNHVSEALCARERENRDLARRLLWAQDTERRGVARELHDELGPYLFGLRASLDSLERQIDAGARPGETRATIARLTDTAQAIQTRSRRIISDLRPMALGELSVGDLVRNGIAAIRRMAPDTRIDLMAGQCNRTFGEAVDLTVYRFVQESTLNAIRHGKAGLVTVEIREDAQDGLLSVVVTDDGAGPNPNDTRPGYGLLGLAERVAVLDGQLLAPWRQDGHTRTEMHLSVVTARAIGRGPQ